MALKILILGSTGSIGENAVAVARKLKNVSVVGLAALNNYKKLAEQAKILRCRNVAIGNESLAPKLSNECENRTKLYKGTRGIVEMVRNSEADIVLCAIVGLEGLFPAIESLRNGKTLALASKEIIVAAGQHIIDIAKKHKAMIIPVDSEHSAIFQCLEGKNKNELKRVILTASGGPFRKMSPSRISQASPGSALLHPTWKMGEKISVDSATLMNKALEMVEAKWLFALAPGQISVVIHPQSIIHSMVEFIDGAIFAQMSPPDMRLAIQYSFTYPKRVKGNLKNFDFAKFAKLDFEIPDRKKFPSLDFADEVIKKSGTLPAVMNAANEVAVDKFLKSEIKIPDIWKIIERAMSSHKIIRDPSLEEILAADAVTRRTILENYS